MWFKVDDKFHDHEKVQRLLEDGHLEALGLWVVAASWCGDQLTDGRVTPFVLSRWSPDWRELAAQLVDVGLWEVVEHDGRDVHEFHDWTDYNDSREKILAERAMKAMRDALHKDPRLKAAINDRDKGRCRYCGTLVNWRSKRGRDAGTYDHVIPISEGGRNTLENVVVCCGECNSRKGKRSLREAGMKKLAPGSLGAPVLDEDAPAPSSSKRAASATGSGRVGSGRVSEAEAKDGFKDALNPGSETGGAR